ncbi:MAG: FliM/FliN family flagellar motor switch protein [Terriglobales bacterium]
MIDSESRADVFVDSIRSAMAEVFSQALASSYTVALKDPESPGPAADNSRVCFVVSVSSGLRGDAAIRVQAADVLLLAQRFLGESPDPAQALSSDHKEAVEELLRQVAGVAATAMKGQFGEVKLDVSTRELPSSGGVTLALLATDASSTPALELQLSTELVASLESNASTLAKEVQKVAAPDLARDSERGLDRLMGIDLNLSLRFGQRSLTLSEIIDLNSGSIIELDRRVDEPAELFLGDKLIAKGEVVVVDGNYGIRVTEVPGALMAATK